MAQSCTSRALTPLPPFLPSFMSFLLLLFFFFFFFHLLLLVHLERPTHLPLFFFVCQITAPSLCLSLSYFLSPSLSLSRAVVPRARPTKRRLVPLLLHVRPRLRQYKAIRGNAKQRRASAYIGLTVTQSAAATPLLRETNNGATFRFRAVKTGGPIFFSSSDSLSRSLRPSLRCAPPAANGYP